MVAIQNPDRRRNARETERERWRMLVIERQKGNMSVKAFSSGAIKIKRKKRRRGIIKKRASFVCRSVRLKGR